MEIHQYFYLIIFLIILQSVVGVGILVVGTPLLLLLNYNIIDVISFLLPISIITSFINLFFIEVIHKNKFKFCLDSGINKNFFLHCVPGIFFGILLIKNFQEVSTSPSFEELEYYPSLLMEVTKLVVNNSNFIQEK